MNLFKILSYTILGLVLGLVLGKVTIFYQSYNPPKAIFIADENSNPIVKTFGLASVLSAKDVVNRLASVSYKYITFQPGLRREQIADEIGEEMEWSDEFKERFIGNSYICPLSHVEGKLAAGTYLIDKEAVPEEIREVMIDNFNSTFSKLLKEAKKKDISEQEIITIASLLEREAGGKNDMRIISGIIRNRLNKDMTLDIDASLQYAKAKSPIWWPMVYPKDKFIDSPFNTYQEKGLPPTPISNPGQASLYAALNPQATNCFFYFHDENGKFYCSKTYDEHKQKVKWYLQ